MKALFSGHRPDAGARFLERVRRADLRGQASMPVFARAPLVVRGSADLPVLAAEFMHWWETSPFVTGAVRPLMPVSTEQVLHPCCYARRTCCPLISAPECVYEDVLGESEVGVLTQLAGASEVRVKTPVGWGDRYRVYRTPAGPACGTRYGTRKGRPTDSFSAPGREAGEPAARDIERRLSGWSWR